MTFYSSCKLGNKELYLFAKFGEGGKIGGKQEKQHVKIGCWLQTRLHTVIHPCENDLFVQVAKSVAKTFKIARGWQNRWQTGKTLRVRGLQTPLHT